MKETAAEATLNKLDAVAMFKLETHKELIKATPTDKTGVWVERQSLVRDDGVRLDKIGSGREMQSYFLYTDPEVSFELTAADVMWEGGPIEYWDHWEVVLGPALKMFSPFADGPVSLAKAKEIARNLEEALMVWPRLSSRPLIRQVKFLMKFWPLWNPAWGDWVTVNDLDKIEEPIQKPN
jgi:hypothetical protein